MRINKYLAECGLCSRRKADEYVKQGRVSINKKVIYEVGVDVKDDDVVYVDGKKVVKVLHYDYIMFNKPKGCVTTVNEDKDNKIGRKDTTKEENSPKKEVQHKQPRRTVMDYLSDSLKQRRLFPVGRLDYDTEGLLLLTNDGDLTYKLTHPSSEIPKTYIVKIEGGIDESDLAILRKGVRVEGTKFGKCKVRVTGIEKRDPNDERPIEMMEMLPGEVLTRLEVIIFEGKNREIRRMFEAVEKKVVFLKRVAIGDLRLGGVPRGSYRELNDFEIEYLKKL